MWGRRLACLSQKCGTEDAVASLLVEDGSSWVERSIDTRVRLLSVVCEWRSVVLATVVVSVAVDVESIAVEQPADLCVRLVVDDACEHVCTDDAALGHGPPPVGQSADTEALCVALAIEDGRQLACSVEGCHWRSVWVWQQNAEVERVADVHLLAHSWTGSQGRTGIHSSARVVVAKGRSLVAVGVMRCVAAPRRELLLGLWPRRVRLRCCSGHQQEIHVCL